MNKRCRYYSLNFPEVWDEFFTSSIGVPEGYDLVEKPEYKKQRLKKEIEFHKSNIENYKRYLSEEEKSLENKTKELKEIK